jgi:hypothetical protein
MAETGIYCSGSHVTDKAGYAINATAKAEAYLNNVIFQAESVINVLCRKTFASTQAAFAALPASTRGFLTDATSNLAAMYVRNFDYTSGSVISRTEGENILNVCRDGFLRDLSILRDKKQQDFLMTGVEN